MPGYLGTIAVVTAMILALPLLHAHEAGMTVTGLLLLGLLAAVPASDLAIALINRAVMGLLGPRRLPRMELRDGVPEDLRTIVVMPTLLTTAEEIAEQVERLEVHYLANPDGDLRFALLSDWVDAPSETLPGDDELLAVAVDGIARLNKRYGPAPGDGERFFLFHRKRVWNECDGKWMGWERKRGKLHELNQLLARFDEHHVHSRRRPSSGEPCRRSLRHHARCGHAPAARRCRSSGRHDGASSQSAEVQRSRRARRGRLCHRAAAHHPSLPIDHRGSLSQRIFSGPGGIDPYSSAVSDVYQDLFQEGSYTGKGIYDIDAFEAAWPARCRKTRC